jgi:hypothetical protein
MGKKKGSDPKPSDQEKMLAAVGAAEHKIFKDLYLGTDTKPGPLLKMRNQAAKEDFSNLFQSRANADIFQKVGKTDYQSAFSMGESASLASGLGKGMEQAKVKAVEAKADQQGKVLAAARKQAATTTQRLGESAKIDSDLALANYNARQSRKAEQLQIAMKAAGAAAQIKGEAGSDLQKVGEVVGALA